MKQKIVLIITLFSILLTGCSSSNKEENTFVAEGKAALEKHEYKEAMSLLSSALEADTSDEEARSMYVQAMRMMDVLEYENQGNYDKAIKELEIIVDLKGGSSAIKSEASAKKKQLDKLNEEQKKAEKERKENAKVSAANGKYKAEKEAYEANQKIKAEKAEKELADKEKEEQEKAEQNANNPTNNNPENKTPNTPATPPTATIVPNGQSGNTQ